MKETEKKEKNEVEKGRIVQSTLNQN